MLSLHWPWLLLALPLPFLVSRLVPAASQGGAIRLPASIAMGATLSNAAPQRPWLALLIWCLLVLAASRPMWLGESITLPAAGRDIVLAVDLSGSMDERDISFRGRTVQRLAVVQAVAGDFIGRREGDRLGLVLFGQNAYLQSPLSLDRATTRQLLDEAEVGLAGQKTAIGDAIGLSVKHLLEAGRNEERVVVLLTDGESNAGHLNPEKSAELAAQSGVRVHTIGFSGEQTVRMGPFVQRRQSPIDAQTLKQVADTTGGRFFAAQSVAELEQIYALLDEIEPVELDTLSFRPRKELHFWPAGLALLLIALKMLIAKWPQRRGRVESHA
ncbi:MAG: VWA domain-containing protein [Oceanococcus sp.]